MSDIFENDIDRESENIEGLEENEASISEGETILEVDYPLFQLKLDYSNETIYAKNPSNQEIKAGTFVIAPTRYGKDMARVLGIVKKPIGIKQSDIVTIERKASAEDMKKLEELRKKEKDAFPIFKEKVEIHKLDMKLIQTHFLLMNQKHFSFSVRTIA